MNYEVDYEQKKLREIEQYSHVETLVHDDLPNIMNYWTSKIIAITDAAGIVIEDQSEFRPLLREMCQTRSEVIQAVSFGTGICEHEIRLAENLISDGVTNFHIECLEFNPDLVERAEQRIAEKGLGEYLTPIVQDVNVWRAEKMYDFIIGAWAFHHFVELEYLFDEIKSHMTEGALFVMSDVIGRNGHVRWPEAKPVLDQLWAVTPEKYKFNNQSKQLDKDAYFDADCSLWGFEGIRSQDILPLLLERFNFRNFAGYSNISEKFYERAYGDNFSPDNEDDRRFVDDVFALDESLIDLGVIKPCRMTAVMVNEPVDQTRYYKHWSPEYCVRYPDDWSTKRTDGTTVVMVVQDDLEATLQGIESVLLHSPGSLRFIVVDNGSTDGTSSALSGVADNIEVITNQASLPSQIAWQQGMEKATGQYVMVVTSDIRVTEGWFDEVAHLIDSDETVAVSPIIMSGNGNRGASNSFDSISGVCLVMNRAACQEGRTANAVLAQRSIVLAAAPVFS